MDGSNFITVSLLKLALCRRPADMEWLQPSNEIAGSFQSSGLAGELVGGHARTDQGHLCVSGNEYVGRCHQLPVYRAGYIHFECPTPGTGQLAHGRLIWVNQPLCVRLGRCADTV